MFNKCQHSWEKLSEVVLPSAYEQMNERSRIAEYMFHSYFTRKLVIILTCSKCGEVKEIVESNPR